MYKVMLAVKSEKLLKEITALHIWGEATGFEIAAAEDSILSAYGGLEKQMYDLLIAEILPSDHGTFNVLKRIRAEGLCRRIALCGEKGDFQSAREGMIIGAYDYFVRPFEPSRFISLFARIKNEINGSMAADIYYIEELAELFEDRSPLIGEYIDSIIDSSFSEIIVGAAEAVLERFEWLDLYIKVVDIANRLDYKDIGYFSRQFKKLFGLTPSEYRIPDNYNIEI
ncbi:MAG: AraC family transcriptional regulator [Oscillospiraceae bacterium]